MGEFSQWYGHFLTELPGGGVPMHKKRAASARKVEQPLDTCEFQSLVREVHILEGYERQKLHSLPALERRRSPSPEAKFSRNELVEESLPLIGPSVDATGKPSLKGCNRFLKKCLDKQKQRQVAQVLVTDGLVIQDAVQPIGKKMYVPKPRDHSEVVTDDIVDWQSGIIEKRLQGKDSQARLVVKKIIQYDVECIDKGLTLQKAKDMCKLFKTRGHMLGKQNELNQKSLDYGLEIPQSSIEQHEALDFVWKNRKDVLSQKKEFRCTMLLQACSKNAKRNLEVKEKSLNIEEEWKQEVHRNLVDRLERQRRHIQQMKWLPVFVAVQSFQQMKALVTRAQEFRVRFKERQAAARLIQATYRKIRQKRQMLNLSLSVKALIKRKMKRWLIHIHQQLKHRHIKLVKQVLKDYVKMRSVVLFINKYKSNVIKCQRFIRAFLNAKRLRQKEMSKQWDQVARDIIGEDAGRHWMFRLLNSAKMDENGKAVPDKDATSGLRLFKEERILIEVRRLRKQYLLNRDEYKEIVKVFKAKLELCHQVSSMGLDSNLVRHKLGIDGLKAEPRMGMVAQRAIIRHSVELALKHLGILDFLLEMLFEQFKDKTERFIEVIVQKYTYLTRNNIKVRDLFDQVDERNNGLSMLEEEELKAFLEKLEIKLNYQEAHVLFARLDFLGKGSLKYNEFVDRVKNWKKMSKEYEKLRSEARAAESRKNGSKRPVDADELRQIQESIEGDMSQSPNSLKEGSGSPVDGGTRTKTSHTGISRMKSTRTPSISRTTSVMPAGGAPGMIKRTPSIKLGS